MGLCCVRALDHDDSKPLLTPQDKLYSIEAQRLAEAAAIGDYEAVNALLGECTTIAINEKDATGCTALFRAVSNNHVSIAKLLLTLGASPNEATSDGHTPLHAAAKNGNYEMCKILLQHKANLNALTNVTHSAPLHIAVQQNHYHIVQLLVEHGAQVNICYTPPPQQQQQKSSLLTTTSSNNLFSASPIAMPTPLLVACSLGHTDIVQYLLQNGASVATEDNGGNTALMTCCEQGHLQTAMFLIAYFKDSAKQQINKKSMTFHLWTCLHFAASAGHTQIVRLLLDNGAFVDALDDIGRTPLHHASARGHPEVVMLLIERGANVEIKDDQFGREDGGKTALDLATESIHYHRVSRAFKEALAKRQHGSLLTADNVSNGSYNNQPHPVFFQSSPLSFKSRNLLRTRLHSRTPSADRSDFFKNSSQQQV